MMAKMVFILTDSAQRYFDPNDKNSVEIVKIANMDDMSEYQPFGLYYCVDEECTRTGFNVTDIKGDSQSVSVDGYTKVGIVPLASTETFSIGDSYTADGMFEVSADGSSRKEASVEITDIVIAENKEDLEGILNAMQKLETQFGRKMKYAEQVIDDDGVLMKAESEDFDFDGYDTFMAEQGLNAFPTHHLYESNV